MGYEITPSMYNLTCYRRV